MSTTLDTKLSATLINSSSLPFAEVDSILGTGSLLLFEPNHPSNPQIGTAIPQVTYNQQYSSQAVPFPNIASRAAGVNLATQTGTTWTITASAVINYQGVTVSSWGSCPGVHPGDELWNAGQTVLLGTVCVDRDNTGTIFAIYPMATWSSQTVVVKRGTKPLVWRYNDSKNSSNVEVTFATEWTPMGGIHLASSRTTMSANGPTIGLALPGAHKEYMYANPSHLYYFSVWYKLTATLGSAYGTQNAPYIFPSKNSGSSNYFFQSNQNGFGTMASVAMPVGTKNTVGMIVEQMANSYTGTALANTYSDFMPWLFCGVGGPIGAFGPTYSQNDSMSAVFYRAYLEDLTVSGRTFAQVKAKDDAAYTVAFGTGGRYNGDTYTAPTTLIA